MLKRTVLFLSLSALLISPCFAEHNKNHHKNHAIKLSEADNTTLITPEQRIEAKENITNALDNMTPSEKAQVKNKAIEAWSKLTPEQQATIKSQIQANTPAGE